MTQLIKNSRAQPVRIGLIGAGEVAENRLLPALFTLPETKLWSIASRNIERAKTLTERFGACAPQPAFTSLDEMLLDPELDAVIIATPDKLHAEMAIKAANAGKQVFVEKPMATDVDDAERMIVAAKANNVKLAVGYHLRHHAGHHMLRAQIDKGMMGTPKHVRVMWSYNAPANDWRASEALARWWSLAAVGTHAIDLAMWFLKEEGVPLVQSEIFRDEGLLEHSATVNLKWASGKTATIVVSNRATLPRLIEVVGTVYTARCENTLGAHGKGAVSINNIALPFVPVDPYHKELEDFIGAITDDREPKVGGVIGLRNLNILTNVR